MILIFIFASTLHASSHYLPYQTNAKRLGLYRAELCERLLEPDTAPLYPLSLTKFYEALQNESYLVESTGDYNSSDHALSSESGSQPLRAIRLHYRKPTVDGRRLRRAYLDGWIHRVRLGHKLRRIDVALIAMVRLAELEDVAHE